MVAVGASLSSAIVQVVVPFWYVPLANSWRSVPPSLSGAWSNPKNTPLVTLPNRRSICWPEPLARAADHRRRVAVAAHALVERRSEPIVDPGAVAVRGRDPAGDRSPRAALHGQGAAPAVHRVRARQHDRRAVPGAVLRGDPRAGQHAVLGRGAPRADAASAPTANLPDDSSGVPAARRF
jgi:hypothetical protein